MDTTTLAVFGILAFLALVAILRFGDKLDLSVKGPGGMGLDIKGERKWQPQQASGTYRRPSPLARIRWGRLMRVGVVLALVGAAFVYRDTLRGLYDTYTRRDISVEWDERTFLLRNTSGKTLNLSDMYLRRYNGNLRDWEYFYLASFSTSVSRFEPDMCLLAWTYETDYPPTTPDDCSDVFTFTVASAGRFWESSDIGIDEEGAPEQLCYMGQRGDCRFNVPDYLLAAD